jgi:hypothetical protein
VIVLFVIGATYSSEVRSTIGLTGTLYGLVFVLAIGFSVQTVHRASAVIKSGGGVERVRRPLRHIVATELSYAAAASVGIVVVSIAVLVAVPLTTSLDPAIFRIYWLCFFPGLALVPFTLVINGAFQSVHRDYSNLAAALVATLVQAAVASTALLLHCTPTILVIVLGLLSTATALFGVSFRLARLKATGIDTGGVMAVALRRFAAHPLRRVCGVPIRLAGSIDGVVFMGTFAIATFVTIAYSVSDGAEIAFAIALMRAIIVPMKQFGLVGGRMVIQGVHGTGVKLTQRDVMQVCLAIVAVLALIVVALRILTPSLQLVPWSIMVMMIAQLLLEPFSGILYSFVKIVHSPRQGLPALFTSYLAIGIPALLALSALGMASAIAVWACLFGTRVIFTAGVLYSSYRAARKARAQPVGKLSPA